MYLLNNVCVRVLLGYDRLILYVFFFKFVFVLYYFEYILHLLFLDIYIFYNNLMLLIFMIKCRSSYIDFNISFFFSYLYLNV